MQNLKIDGERLWQSLMELARIGATCNAVESVLCATGFGVCNNSVCAALCSGVDFPRCPSGTTEQHVTAGDRELCICIPK